MGKQPAQLAPLHSYSSRHVTYPGWLQVLYFSQACLRNALGNKCTIFLGVLSLLVNPVLPQWPSLLSSGGESGHCAECQAQIAEHTHSHQAANHCRHCCNLVWEPALGLHRAHMRTKPSAPGHDVAHPALMLLCKGSIGNQECTKLMLPLPESSSSKVLAR